MNLREFLKQFTRDTVIAIYDSSAKWSPISYLDDVGASDDCVYYRPINNIPDFEEVWPYLKKDIDIVQLGFSDYYNQPVVEIWLR